MKDETSSVAQLKKSRMYLFLVDNNSEHKEEGLNIYVVAKKYGIANIKMHCWIINVWEI